MDGMGLPRLLLQAVAVVRRVVLIIKVALQAI